MGVCQCGGSGPLRVSAITSGRARGQPHPRPPMGLWSRPAAARGPSLGAHGVAAASLGQGSGGLHGLVRKTFIDSPERHQSLTSCSVLSEKHPQAQPSGKEGGHVGAGAPAGSGAQRLLARCLLGPRHPRRGVGAKMSEIRFWPQGCYKLV